MAISLKRLSNQSWFEIDAGDKIVHVDPAYLGVARRGAVACKMADLILFTHDHRDHCDPVAVQDLSRGDTVLAGAPSCAKFFSGKGRILAPGDSLECGDVKIRATDAYTTGAIRHFLHRKGACVGYLITGCGHTVYHAGDTDVIPEMASLGHVDVALLPIGGLFTMDIGGAVRAAKAIGPKIVVPMHQNRADPAAFKEKMASAAPEIKVVLMGAGEEITL